MLLHTYNLQVDPPTRRLNPLGISIGPRMGHGQVKVFEKAKKAGSRHKIFSPKMSLSKGDFSLEWEKCVTRSGVSLCCSEVSLTSRPQSLAPL